MVPSSLLYPYSLDNIKAEIRGYRNPLCFAEKEWFGQEYATDLWVLHRFDGYASVLRDPFAHFRKRSNAVAFSEGLPSKRDRQLDETREEPSTDDVITWSVKFEQEHFAQAESFERCCWRWTPEIDFLYATLRRMQ